MLKRYFSNIKLSFLLFVFFLPAFFITTAFDLQAKSADVEQATQSCLWTVNTQSNKIYLLGSLHILKANAYPLAVAIEKAYADSRVIIFETDIAALQTPGLQTKLLELGIYPADQNLLQNLDADTRQQLEKKMSEIGLPLEQFSQFKPWFVALTLTTLELQRMGYNPNYGIDVYFFNKARADGKEVGFLEPAEFQINLLGKMVEQDQYDFLSQTLNDLEVVNELAGDLVRSWKYGDTAKLHELLSKSFKDYPRLHDRLLIQRNKNWVQQIEGAMRKNKNVLFVVGAGHLVGPESVVDMLKERGYQVKQQ
ncbi:MAG: TraB/GumN family protein [Desulfobacterales bacterium]